MAQTPAVHLPLVIVNLVYLSAISLFLKHLKQEAAQLRGNGQRLLQDYSCAATYWRPTEVLVR